MSEISKARGRKDAALDYCASASFSCIGGKRNRHSPKKPSHVDVEEWPEYLKGYEEHCEEMFGKHWRDCTFDWYEW